MRSFLKSAAIAVAIALGLLAAGFLDRDTGVGRWIDLRRDAAEAQRRIESSQARIERREAEAAALRDDPIAIEAAIREDLGLARPGEWIVREAGSTSLRNP